MQPIVRDVFSYKKVLFQVYISVDNFKYLLEEKISEIDKIEHMLKLV